MKSQHFKKYISVPDFSFKKALREIGHNAYVDWLLVLLLTFVMGLALVAGGVYLYNEVTNGKIISADQVAPPIKAGFDEKSFASLVKSLDAKKNALETAKQGYVGEPDPSI